MDSKQNVPKNQLIKYSELPSHVRRASRRKDASFGYDGRSGTIFPII